MALNRDFIGRSHTASEVYEVSREKVRDYAMAIDELNPVYFSEAAAQAAGYPTVIAPPTFATGLWFRLGAWPMRGEPDLGRRTDPSFLMGQQRVTHYRPIQLGDRLVLTTSVTDIRAAAPHEILEVEHQIVTEQGERVCAIADLLLSLRTAAPAGGRR